MPIPPNTNDPDENAPPPLAEVDSLDDDDDLVTRAFTVAPQLVAPGRVGIHAGPSATVEIARSIEKAPRRPRRWLVAALAIVALLVPGAWWFFRPPPESLLDRPAEVDTSALVQWLRPDALLATRPAQLTRVRLSRDGKQALISGFKAELALWDVAARKEVQRFIGHTDIVWGVAVSPDGKTVVSGSQDRTVRFWEANTGKQRGSFLTGDTVSGVCFSPDGRLVAATCWDAKLRIWQADGTVRGTFPLSEAITDPAFTPDGSQLFLGTASGTLLLCETGTGKVVRQFKGHPKLVHTVALSSDGQRGLSGSIDGSVRLWDMATATTVYPIEAHVGETRQVAFLPDGERFVTAGEDRTLRLWDVRTGKQLAVGLAHRDRIYGVAVSSDGGSVLTTSFDGTLRAWRLPTPRAKP